MCLNHWWVFISCLHAPGAGRQTEPPRDIYKTEINALNGALQCLHLEAHAQCAYLWLIYELRWALWYLIEITLWNGRLHKRQRIINKLHNWIPEVSRVVKIYLQLIRVHIRGTGLMLLWPLRRALNATFGDSVINCLEPPHRMAFYPFLTWPRK